MTININELETEQLEFFENELNNSLKNFNKFKDTLINKDIIAIDLNKSNFKLDKYVREYCKKNNFTIIGNLIYLKENDIPIKTKFQLETERLLNLKRELILTISKESEIKKEIEKLERCLKNGNN